MGRRVVVIGNGNVAIDLVRLLAKGASELHGSDILIEPGAGVQGITIVGRSPAEVAKFDPVMLKELARLEGCAITVSDLTGEGKVIEALDDHDDVQEVYSNFDISEEILAELAG